MNRNRPPCFQYTKGLAKGSSLIGEEHHSKLADGTVEFVLAKGQCQCIGLLPVHAVHPRMRSRAVEHRQVEIGGRDVHRLREQVHKGAGNDTRSRRDFQHVSDSHTPQPFGKYPRIRREKHWNQEVVIKLRIRPDEKPYGSRHCPLLLEPATRRSPARLGHSDLIYSFATPKRDGAIRRRTVDVALPSENRKIISRGSDNRAHLPGI